MSVSGRSGVVWLLGWALGGFAASGLYLVLPAFELAFARVVRALLPLEDLEEDDGDFEDEPEFG